MSQYPGAPSWITGTRAGLWWKYTDGRGTVSVCASQGLSVVRGAQDFLKNIQNVVQTTDVFGTHIANTNNLTLDGIVGPNTIKVAHAYFHAVGTAPALIADIEADFNEFNRTNALGQDVSRPGGALREGTQRALIWLAAHHDGDLARVEVQPRTVPIRWGVAPASDGAGAGTKVCWRMDQPVPPEAGGAAGAPAGTSTPTGGGGATGGGGGGGGQLPSGSNESTPMSTGAKVGVAAAITVVGGGVIGGIAYAVSKKSKKRKRN